jgi:membrane protease YdiL (CAAX protease family)
VWLIVQTDRIFRSERTFISWGLLITIALFALLHLLTTQSVENALRVAAIFFALGLIFKSTRNAIGPMLAWTLLNGQVWFLAQLLRP